MPVVLYRVDERLIHGQVVLGWGSRLRPDRYVVVDADLAESDWEQELYRLGAGDAEALFVTLPEARRRLEEWEEADTRTILLTRDLGTMRALSREGALRGKTVNVGGVHHGPGRNEVLTYVHLSEEDRADIRGLVAGGVRVTARDLPDSHAVSLPDLLDS